MASWTKPKRKVSDITKDLLREHVAYLDHLIDSITKARTKTRQWATYHMWSLRIGREILKKGYLLTRLGERPPRYPAKSFTMDPDLRKRLDG